MKLRSVAITVTIIYCLFLISTGYAAEIISLTTLYVGYDYGEGRGWVSVRLIADADISYIDWYINGQYDKTTMHSHGTRWVYTSLDGFPGELKGKRIVSPQKFVFGMVMNLFLDTGLTSSGSLDQ